MIRFIRDATDGIVPQRKSISAMNLEPALVGDFVTDKMWQFAWRKIPKSWKSTRTGSGTTGD
jgi:hypothetical protein